MRVRTVVALMAASLSVVACEQNAAPAEQNRATQGQSFALCEAFAADTTQAGLVERFGAEVVRAERLPGPEGTTFEGTVLYPDDPARRVEITWHDETARAGLASAAVYAPESKWTGPGGVGVGATLDALQTANGRPFDLYGFQWDYGGTVANWNGGALDGDGCRLHVTLEPTDTTDETVAAAVAGDGRFSSADPNVRAVAPVAATIAVGWPPQGEPAPAATDQAPSSP